MGEYCDSLGFDDRPDYEHLRCLMRDVFIRECHQHDKIFDWMLVKQKRKPLALKNGDRKRTRSSQLKKVARKDEIDDHEYSYEYTYVTESESDEEEEEEEEDDSNEEEEETESEEEEEDSSKCASPKKPSQSKQEASKGIIHHKEDDGVTKILKLFS